MIHHGDCLDVMAAMEPESVDAIVTDPPYEIGFMSRSWDKRGVAFDPRTWELAYRVAKPSAYLLAFGGTRTVHRMTVALEDAGWIIRDMLVWAYASGFPKSKASLKPAWEPIVMARKPGPLRELAIDACRIPTSETWDGGPTRDNGGVTWGGPMNEQRSDSHPLGRWPANVVLTATEDGRAIFDGGWDGVVGGGETTSGKAEGVVSKAGTGFLGVNGVGQPVVYYGDSGTYSRFFVLPKADRADREPVLGGLPERAYEAVAHKRCVKCGKQEVNVPGSECRCDEPEWASAESVRKRANVHPTVKPTELMCHLVRLVTPPGGTVLDPFLGSGTTALAAEQEGFAWIGIEREAEYVAIAEARLNGTQRGLGLTA